MGAKHRGAAAKTQCRLRRNSRICAVSTSEHFVQDGIACSSGSSRLIWAGIYFSVIAYEIQVNRFGDLDHETKKLLDRTAPADTSHGTDELLLESLLVREIVLSRSRESRWTGFRIRNFPGRRIRRRRLPPPARSAETTGLRR